MIAFKTLFLSAGVYASVCVRIAGRGGRGFCRVGKMRGGVPEPHKIFKMFPTVPSRVQWAGNGCGGRGKIKTPVCAQPSEVKRLVAHRSVHIQAREKPQKGAAHIFES